jgi:hypothetical protein
MRQTYLAEGAVPASEYQAGHNQRVKKWQTYLAEGAVPASEHQAGHNQEGEEVANLPGRRSCPCQ